MTELKILTQKEEFLTTIKWNKDELKAALDEISKNYENLVYSSDNIADAKNDKAELSELIKKISDRRIEVKKLAMAGYNDFEKDLKDITEVVNTTIDSISRQIAEYEYFEKKAKKEEILKIFKEKFGKNAEILDFKTIFKKEYLNKGFSLKKIEKEFEQKNIVFETDMVTIEKFGGKNITALKSLYLDTMDISKVLEKAAALDAIDQQLQAKKESEEKETEKKEQIESLFCSPVAKEEQTNIIKCQFLKDGVPAGREYTYFCDDMVEPGCVVYDSVNNSDLIVTQKDISEKEIESFKDKMKTVVVKKYEDIPEPEAMEKKYSVRYNITSTLSELKKISEFLKNNNIKYFVDDEKEA